MTPDDPRHGTRAGYIAGCRNNCCRDPHIRYQKRSTYRRHLEGSQIVNATKVIDRMNWWAERGVSRSGLHRAAGLGEGTLAELALGQRDTCLKTTMRAVLAITWDDLPDNALCNPNITHARIYSLMAAGHNLKWICDNTERLSVGGKWRTQEKITVGLARAVLNTYQNAPLQGPSPQTATKARRRGHVHPLAWDDPGDLAMPHGWRVPSGYALPPEPDGIDEAVVLRLLRLEHVKSTRAEKEEAMRRWLASGRSQKSLSEAHGWRDNRYKPEDAA